MVTRRTVLGTLLAVLGSACAPASTASTAGLRGAGTVLRTDRGAVGAPPEATPAATPTRIVPPASADAALSPSATASHPSDSASFGATAPGDELAAQARVIPVPSGPPPAIVGLPPRRIVIPNIGVDSRVIALGTTRDRNGDLVWETPPFAVGWYKGTGAPGQPGNMVLGGHISSPNEGAVFKRLPEIRVGDGVIVSTDDQIYLYRVSETVVVSPDRVDVMAPTRDPIATLITCVPDGVYTQRLVVTARLVR